MLSHYSNGSIVGLKKRPYQKLIISIISIFMVAIVSFINIVSTVNAASTPIYTYANSGSEIGATGGMFESTTTKLVATPAGSNTYIGEVQTTFTYGNGWGWFFGAGNQTVTCIAGVRIVTSSDSTGSISTPAELNVPHDTISAAGSTVINHCSAEIAAKMPDYNQSSISIGGSKTDGSAINNEAELDNTKDISVSIYSDKPGKDLPAEITATLSDTAGNSLKSNVFTFSDSYSVSQKIFNGISPGQYNICITPTGTFTFNQCQSVTKVRGEILSVNFGDTSTVFNSSGKNINTKIIITTPDTSTDGSYGPLTVDLYKLTSSSDTGSGSFVLSATSDTKSSSMKFYDNTLPLSAVFENIEPGYYKACLKDIPNQCSSAIFEKKANITAETTINVTLEGSNTLFTSKEAAAGTKTCGIGGVGWILCPILSFGSQMADKMFDMFSGFLQTSPTIFTFKDANGGNTVFIAWSAMRNIANVLFVIVFLIVIFSQVTGTGITNYGIKKILPKLVVAAILVNLSYYICQIAVDLSNILGFSLQGFIQGLIPAGSIGTQESFGLFDIFEGTALVVAGGVILWASLAALIPAIAAAIVGLLMILFILIARQAIIIILIIISPLAFIAFMLPNTEKLFKKWLDTLKSMLLLFPIIAIVFGTSKLASGVLQAVFNQNQNPDFLNVGKIASAAILILPLFVVPSLLKGALDGIGKLGAKINGIGDKWSKGASDKTKGSRAIQNLEALKANRKLRRDNMAINGTGNRFQRVIGTPRRSLMQTQARLAAIKQSQESEAKRATSEYLAKDISAPDSRLLQQMSAGGSAGVADRSKASAISILEKMKAEEVSAQTALIKNLDQATIQTLSMGGSVTNPNTGITYNASNNIALRTAAMKKTIDESDIHGINNLIDQASSGGMNIDTMQSFADVLSTSSGRPSYVGAGAIAQIRQGSTKNSTDLAISAINNNTYSPDKLASASKDELALISSIARNDNTAPIGIGGVDINITRATPGSAPVDTTLIKASAEKAATEAVYAGRIAKQRGQIEDLRNL